jgi:transcription antitermination factor NusG
MFQRGGAGFPASEEVRRAPVSWRFSAYEALIRMSEPGQPCNRSAIDSGWLVLRTQPRHEIFVANAMDARHVEAYVPLLKTKPSDDRARPLFPGYLFARIPVQVDTDDLLRVGSAPGIAYFLPRGGPPAIVPQCVVDMVRRRLADWRAGQPSTEPRPGERVELVGGTFSWLDAVFDLRLHAAARICVLLEIVHRTQSAQPLLNQNSTRS